MEKENLAQWLEEKCKQEHLSLRQVAVRAGLSHATLYDISRKGTHPLPGTILKLAQGFGGGASERLALEDKLLTLAGYRTPRQGEELNEALAQIIDKVRGFNEKQIKVMLDFADFLQVLSDKLG